MWVKQYKRYSHLICDVSEQQVLHFIAAVKLLVCIDTICHKFQVSIFGQGPVAEPHSFCSSQMARLPSLGEIVVNALVQLQGQALHSKQYVYIFMCMYEASHTLHPSCWKNEVTTRVCSHFG
jgi:hypothetical protein